MPVILWIANLFGISIVRLIVYAACIAAVIGALLWVRQHYINVGKARAYNEIAADNREAKENVNAAKSRVAQCRASGGVWDTVDGVCQQP